jgi:MFS family permease
VTIAAAMPARRAIDRPAAVAAAISMGLAGSAIPILIPIMIQALARYRGLDLGAAASVMSGEMLGTTVSTALFATLIGRVNRRRLALAALMVCALADLASMGPISSAAMLYTLRFTAGLAEGALIAVSSSTLGGTAQPARNFAFFLVGNLLLSALMIRTAPEFLGQFGVNGIFASLLLLRLLALLALPFLPSHAPVPTAAPASGISGATRVSLWSRQVLPALLGVMLLFTAVGTVWPLMPQFGARYQISELTVANTLSNATVVGLIAALLASWVGVRWGRILPIFAATALLVVGLLLLAFGGARFFGLVTAIFMGAWMFNVPYYLATLAAADPSGRAVAFSMSLQFCGMSLGPLIGPRINGSLDGNGAVWLACAMLTIAVVLILARESSRPPARA